MSPRTTPITGGARVIWAEGVERVEQRGAEPLWVSVRYVSGDQSRAGSHADCEELVIEVTSAPPAPSAPRCCLHSARGTGRPGRVSLKEGQLLMS